MSVSVRGPRWAKAEAGTSASISVSESAGVRMSVGIDVCENAGVGLSVSEKAATALNIIGIARLVRKPAPPNTLWTVDSVSYFYLASRAWPGQRRGRKQRFLDQVHCEMWSRRDDLFEARVEHRNSNDLSAASLCLEDDEIPKATVGFRSRVVDVFDDVHEIAGV